MSKFIKYENIDFRINNSVFYSTSVKIAAQTNIQPVLLSDGTLLRYAPSNTVIGSLDTQFYLTGALPSYLLPANNSEDPVPCSFAGISIDNCYIKNISFSVEPFVPILVSATFDWYGTINAKNSFSNQTFFTKGRNPATTDVSHADYSYVADSTASFGFTDILTFNYSEECDRVPFFANDSTVPFRVAKTNKSKSLGVEGNKLINNLISIYGSDSTCSVYLKNYGGTLLNTFDITGKLMSQNQNISNNGVLQGSINIKQTVAPNRQSLHQSNDTSSYSYIAQWGDSMTELMGTGLSSALNDLGIQRRVSNKGVTSERSLQIAARQGGAAISGVFTSNTIPSDTTPVSVALSSPSFYSGLYFLQFGPSSIPVNVNGVDGTLQRTSATPTYTFTRNNAGQSVSATSPNLISPKYIDPDTGLNLNQFSSIFWVGTNGQGSNPSTDNSNIEILQGMIDFIPVKNKKIMILPMFGQNIYNYNGLVNYWRLQNNLISAAFLRYWFDARSLFLNQAQSYVVSRGGTWTADDANHVSVSGVIPPSLAADDTHMNSTGYDLYCSILAKQIKQLNW